METLHLSWHHEADSESDPALFKSIAPNCPYLKVLYTMFTIWLMLQFILNTLDSLLDVSFSQTKLVLYHLVCNVNVFNEFLNVYIKMGSKIWSSMLYGLVISIEKKSKKLLGKRLTEAFHIWILPRIGWPTKFNKKF